MADWIDLYNKTHEAAQAAQGYLQRRTSSTTSESELERLQELEVKIQDSAAGLEIVAGDVAGQARTFQTYFDQLDLTHSQILGLHENDPVEAVEAAIGNLHRQMIFLAGPHGPGKGRPMGPGPQGWGGGHPGRSGRGGTDSTRPRNSPS